MKRFISTIAFISVLLPHHVAIAATSDEFNPNFILSDEELQDWDSMDRSGIQAFLEERGGFLPTFRTEDKDGTRRLASDIIYNAAVENKINPKYLLVKLQKEQSLITEDDPTQKQLDGATGYGITDGCGWTCESYFNNQGFGKQVDAAAGIMRWYYENVGSQSWIKRPPLSYSIDGQFVTPQSYATAFLYTYTPHIQGNKNFWTLWQDWFDQVYPDGSLLQAANDTIVYILQDGKKRPFASMAALATRYDPKQIITVPSSELARYDLGTSISLPNYAVVHSGSTYFLLDYDTKRPFATSETVGALGYNPDEILEVSNTDLESYETGTPISAAATHPLGEVIRLKENNSLYYLQDNQYFPIYDEALVKTNFSHLSIQTATLEKIQGLVQGPPVTAKDGTLILVEGDSKVYVIEKGKKRHIASEAVFNGLGYKWENIVRVNEFTGIAHETGEPVYLRSGVATVNTPTTSTEEQTTPQSSTSVPSTNVADLMIQTPKDQWSFIGPEFDTAIDSYIVADAQTGHIVAGKNVDTVRPSASLAKVMTAYELLLEGLNLNASVTANAAKFAVPKDFGSYPSADGEKILTKHLLSGLLVSSNNVTARMLVSSVTDDEAGFLERMNATLHAWGLLQTDFVDVYGGAVENNTTAREYLTIFRHAVSNETVVSYLSQSTYQYDELLDIDGNPTHKGTHTNGLLKENQLPYSILASKTGYIYEAGDNLAMLVRRLADGKEFVIITLGNPNHSTKFEEPKALSIWAMNTF